MDLGEVGGLGSGIEEGGGAAEEEGSGGVWGIAGLFVGDPRKGVAAEVLERRNQRRRRRRRVLGKGDEGSPEGGDGWRHLARMAKGGKLLNRVTLSTHRF